MSFVTEWKRQRREVFVPLAYRPGDLAEVDFFEVLVDLDGTCRRHRCAPPAVGERLTTRTLNEPDDGER